VGQTCGRGGCGGKPRFPPSSKKAILNFEVMGSKLQGKVHPSVAVLGIDVKCPWGIEDIESLEAWNPKMRLVKTTSLIEQYRERWPSIQHVAIS